MSLIVEKKHFDGLSGALEGKKKDCFRQPMQQIMQLLQIYIGTVKMYWLI